MFTFSEPLLSRLVDSRVAGRRFTVTRFTVTPFTVTRFAVTSVARFVDSPGTSAHAARSETVVISKEKTTRIVILRSSATESADDPVLRKPVLREEPSGR
jgi:hypothetical protein